MNNDKRVEHAGEVKKRVVIYVAAYSQRNITTFMQIRLVYDNTIR